MQSIGASPQNKKDIRLDVFFILWRCTAALQRCILSMPRGSAPIIPRGSAFRICLWQIHGSRRRAGARVRGGILGGYGLGILSMPRGSAPIILEDLTGKSSSIGFAATLYA